MVVAVSVIVLRKGLNVDSFHQDKKGSSFAVSIRWKTKRW